MSMTYTQQIITIAAVIVGTMLTRFIPFILFPAGKKTPECIQYLGKVLPSAVFGLLVVYSLKDLHILSGSHGIPENTWCSLTCIMTVLNMSHPM